MSTISIVEDALLHIWSISLMNARIRQKKHRRWTYLRLIQYNSITSLVLYVQEVLTQYIIELEYNIYGSLLNKMGQYFLDRQYLLHYGVHFICNI